MDNIYSTSKPTSTRYLSEESSFTYEPRYSRVSLSPAHASYNDHFFSQKNPMRCSPSTQSLIHENNFDSATGSTSTTVTKHSFGINELQILNRRASELLEKEVLRKERRKRLKLFLEQKHKEYCNNFTVHGLTKSLCSASITERAFWITLILFGSFICLFVLRGLINKYLRYEVYTEIHFEITNKHYYPSVTLCEEQLLFDAYFAYCGVAARAKHPRQNETCGTRSKYGKANITNGTNFWSNGYFNITSCRKEGGGCFDNQHFRSITDLNNSCITWNFDGHLKDEHNQPDITFFFNKPSYIDTAPRIVVIPHHPNLSEIDFTAKIDLDPFKDYTIKLDKTIIKRLPAPYPSNCTYKKLGDVFPGRYSRHGCIEASNHVDMFKKCGDTIDHTYPYVPEDIKLHYEKNITIGEVLKCIQAFADTNTRLFECNFPCDDIDLHIVSTTQTHKEHNDIPYYHISIHYQNIDTYKIMEEKALYKLNQLVCEIGGIIGVIVGMSTILNQLVCEIGGIIGVIVGMSTMSVAEMVFYIILKIAHRYVLNQLVCEIGGIIGVIVGMSTMSVAEIVFYIILKIAHRYV